MSVYVIAFFVTTGVLLAAIFAWIARSRGPAARTIRKAAVRLPIVQSPTVQRLAAATGVAAKTCRTCEYWNHDAGQEIMGKHPAFAQASHWLGPTQMGKPKLLVDGEIEKPALLPENELKWSDFGACGQHHELRAGTDTCKEWS